MEYVAQKHRRGCGPASLSMLCSIPYERALQELQPWRRKGARINVTCENMVDALTRLGLRPRVFKLRRSFKFEAIQQDCILLIRRDDGNYHACVWDSKAKRVRDPDAARAYSPRRYERALVGLVVAKPLRKVPPDLKVARAPYFP